MVRGTQALVSFAPLAFRLVCAARHGQNRHGAMEPITCHMDPISEQVEIHLQVEGHLMDARVQGLASRGSREKNLLALPSPTRAPGLLVDMYLPLSKFESIQRVYITLRCNNNLL